ncbi:hypothetical protein RvY_02321 [Ramazzottius varieornatus]|uniref:RNA-directed DNA polymerase n=1 Tax=Ramazzottius varieornatus TaxID=947166 RepID=A0A1D1URD9_RAMVA|nr:hypothetical protein RvY_02321 [Ramazzottius varieornatus]
MAEEDKKKATFCTQDDVWGYNIQKVLKAFENAGQTIKPEKCKLAESSVIFLGHKLSEKGIEPDMDKLQAIKAMNPPTDFKGVQRFLGSCGFYRQFILSYAGKAEALNKLLKGEKNFVWSKDQQEAFNQLKQALISYPIPNGHNKREI